MGRRFRRGRAGLAGGACGTGLGSPPDRCGHARIGREGNMGKAAIPASRPTGSLHVGIYRGPGGAAWGPGGSRVLPGKALLPDEPSAQGAGNTGSRARREARLRFPRPPFYQLATWTVAGRRSLRPQDELHAAILLL